MALYPISDPSPREVSARCLELVHVNDDTAPARARTRDVMNGGRSGLARLVGRDLPSDEAADLIPAANMMLKANDRLGQKIGKLPKVKIDVETEDEAPNRRADTRVKILSSWDRAAKLPLMLRQVGRWLPGYGFAPATLSLRRDINGDPYPHLGFRDPFNAYPAPWTVDQQPRDIAFRHVVDPSDLYRINPQAYDKIIQSQHNVPRHADSQGFLPREMGGILLNPSGQGGISWENQSGKGVEVWEYVCETGTYWVHTGIDEFLAYVPNVLQSGAPFVVGKRFAFDKLIGQYDQLIGLMAAVTRMNLLALMAVEQGINSETAVIGHMANGQYKTGPGQVNYLLPGSDVKKINDRIPFEALQHLDKLDRQLRSMATYPVTDDGISPNSFVTGLGLEELKGSVELEVDEYQDVVRDLLETSDSKRLEMADRTMAGQSYKAWGVSKGASFQVTWRPERDIKGNYISRRVYGMLSSWDDPNKVVTGIALRQNRVISTDVLRDNIHGLEDHEGIKEQVHDEEVEMALMQLLTTSIQDPASPAFAPAVKALIAELPEGDRKALFTQLFITEPEEQAAEQNQQLGLPPGGAPGGGAPGPIPPTTTILNRLTNNSNPTVGVQTVQTADQGAA